MKTQSDTKPMLFYYLQGGLIINVNEEQKTTIDQLMGEHSYWEYDSFRVGTEPTREEIINSIIRIKYSIDDELSTINNYNTGESKYIIEYQSYQDYRTFSKNTANLILSSL